MAASFVISNQRRDVRLWHITDRAVGSWWPRKLALGNPIACAACRQGAVPIAGHEMIARSTEMVLTLFL